MRKTGNIFFFLLLILMLNSCYIEKRDYFPTNKLPPGTVKVDDNFFYDETEVRNLDWREYQYWTRDAYGIDSEEYKATIPDTTVWFSKDTAFSGLFFKHPAYEQYPIVGISQEQAIEYTKWRTDVVFILMLYRLDVIRLDNALPAKTPCTVERYFNDSCDCITGSVEITGYYKYTLPTIQEYRQALAYSDSCHIHKLSKCWTKECKQCLGDYPEFVSIETYPIDSLKFYIMAPVCSGCIPYKKQVIVNLRGNVGEWSSIENVTFGGSWLDSRDTILKVDTFRVEGKNRWTGYRNVCRWKEWEE